MRLTRHHAILFGVIPAVCFFILLNLPHLHAEEVPLRNGGHRDPALKLESVIDLVNRPEKDNAVWLEPGAPFVGNIGFRDPDHRTTLGFILAGAKKGPTHPLILVQTDSGQYLQTLCSDPTNGTI